MKNDGGPALPYSVQRLQSTYHAEVQGMTLRDWFAGMALQGLIERDTKIAIHELSKADGEPAAPILYKDGSAYIDLANEAYIVADEMLVAQKENQ